MKKTSTVILLFFILFCLSSKSMAQCPLYSPTNYFDTTCFKRLPSELKVGQGHLGSADLWGTTGARSFDFYIPAGKESWAIAVVHSWLTLRNILKYNRDAFNWHSYFGTLMKESFGACDPTLSFTGITRCVGGPALNNPFINLDNYTNNTGAGSVARVDGCFQIDHNTGWPIFPTYYPWRWTTPTQHTTYMADANFETATLAKMYYELAYIRMMEYVKGYPFENVMVTNPDPASGTAIVAMSYNKGFGGTPENIFSVPANVTAANANADWLNTMAFDAPDLNYDYTRAVTLVTKVLSNNYEGGWTRPWGGTGWANTADNQWHCWYDKPISWAMMTAYMNKFFPLFPEVTPATVTAKVKAKFDAINGGNPVSFRYQFAPVIEEFVLNMPYDDPMTGWMYSTAGNSGCHKPSTCLGPDVFLKAKSSSTICSGLSVDLETVVGTGFTYQWFRNGAAIANPNALQNTFTAKLAGTYSVRVTTPGGCSIDSECQITVTVVNCSGCTMTATATGTNNTCTGVPNGSVSVSLTNAPASVTYNWTGPVSGNTATLNNVPDGTYTVTVTDAGNPACKAYATVTIVPTKVVYQKLNLSQNIIDCKTSDLTASVVSNPPSSCTYRLKVVFNCAGAGCCYGTWDNSQLRVIAYANGLNLNVPAPRTNGSGNCDHLDEQITVPHGSAIKVTLDRVAGSTVTGGTWLIQLINPSGTTVANYNMSGVSYTNVLTNIINYTADCNMPVPTFTMTWSPLTELTSISYSPVNNASARAITTADRTYTITAQHPTEPTCAMAKSILVDNTCPPGLPVEWLAFDAVRMGDVVRLNWATAIEKNSKMFYVERSRDGVNFQGIGYVPARGNSNSTQLYTFLDGTPDYGTNYYRIKETDIDDSFRYSGIRMVSISNANTFKVYPNPSADYFFIEGAGMQENQNIRVEMQDLTGKTVLEKNITLDQANPYLFREELPSGLYILKIHDDTSEYAFKMVKN